MFVIVSFPLPVSKLMVGVDTKSKSSDCFHVYVVLVHLFSNGRGSQDRVRFVGFVRVYGTELHHLQSSVTQL